MTKRELEEKIVELQKTLADNGIVEKEDNLMSTIEEVELAAKNKITLLSEYHVEKVKALTEICERETGRKFHLNHALRAPSAKSPDVDLNIEKSDTPLREAARQLVKYVARNGTYVFNTNDTFPTWFKRQLEIEIVKQK